MMSRDKQFQSVIWIALWFLLIVIGILTASSVGGVITALLGGVCLIATLINASRKPTGLSQPQPPPNEDPEMVWTPEAAELLQQLVTLTYGDAGLAGKLVGLVMANNPNASLEWAIQWVIDDIHRSGYGSISPTQANSTQINPEVISRFNYLESLVYGDQQAAQKLTELAWRDDPTQPIEWAIERAIEQLIRDRSR